MKKISFVPVTIIIAIALLAPGCKKSGTPDGPAPGPILGGVTEGFLTTKTGYNTGGLGDTAIVRVYKSSYQIAATYLAGTLEDKVHYWYLENANGNAVYIRSRKYGTYLGYRVTSPASPGYHSWATHWITLDTVPGNNNRFLITKKDKNFYIQPAADQTLYLNTTRSPQISSTNQIPSAMFFLPKQQEFFFLKPF